jgi:uncharacterized membrane protein YkvA (DUF1232 family)
MDSSNKPDNNQYSEEYSEKSLFDKIKKVAKKAGIKIIYTALLLFYTLIKPSTPAWARAAIVGALGYFISPLDAIPDIIPGAGYADDLGALILALVTVALYIDEEVKQKAKERLQVWFGEYDESCLEDIDKKIADKKISRDADNSSDNMKVECPNCGSLNENKAKFCNECGATLKIIIN